MSLVRSLRQLHIGFRLFLSVGLAAVLGLALPGHWPVSTRSIVALDGGGLLFLGLAWLMMARATPASMRLRASLLDESQGVILLLTVGAVLFSLTVISLELHGLKDLPPDLAMLRVALSALSILCSWLVTHTVFALHYAHEYYGDRKPLKDSEVANNGLEFPGPGQPVYWDFLYFSFVIGMTCQTSDVQICDVRLRRLAVAHGILAFFFNTVILALSINIAASLL